MEHQKFLWKAVLLTLAIPIIVAHREHKVHNIVLYPDKHSWCNTTPIKQVVAYPGCSSLEIDNNVCVGTCFSYSIPRTVPSAPGEVIKPYCDSCQPSRVAWKNLTLSCGGEDTDILEMQKSVQIITNCSCSTCDLGDDVPSPLTSTLISSGDGDLSHSYSEGQELMDWMLESSNHRTSGNGMKGFNDSLIGSNISPGDPIMNERLLILLKQLAGGDEDSNENGGERDGSDSESGNLDKIALKELLKEVEGVDHKVNQATLGDFVKQVEEKEHIKVNLDRLRHVLAHFQHEIQREKDHSEQHRHHQHGHHGREHTAEPPSSHHRVFHSQYSAGHHPSREQMESAPSHSHHTAGGAGLDVEPHQLKPAVEGGELSYQENLIQSNEEEETDTHQKDKF